MEVPTSQSEGITRPGGTLDEKTLPGIVGEEHVLERPDQLAEYFAEPADWWRSGPAARKRSGRW
jgi:hypothetical protein